MSVLDVAKTLSHGILHGWKTALRRIDSEPEIDGCEYALPTEGAIISADQPQRARVLWVQCFNDWEFSELAQIQFVCDGLALLQLLQDLDATVWTKTITRVWPDLELDDCNDLPLAIGVMLLMTNQEQVDWITERVVGVEEPSKLYTSTVAKTKKALRAIGKEGVLDRAHVARIPAYIQVEMPERRNEIADRLVRQLLQIAMIQHITIGDVNRASGKRTVCRVVGFGTDGSLMNHASFQRLEYIRRIAEYHNQVPSLSSLSIENAPLQPLTNALHVLIPPETTSMRQYFGVTHVEISEESYQPMTVPVLSALQVSQSVL